MRHELTPEGQQYVTALAQRMGSVRTRWGPSSKLWCTAMARGPSSTTRTWVDGGSGCQAAW